MKKKKVYSIVLSIIIMFIYYYFVLPPINLSSRSFWNFIIVGLLVYGILNVLFSSMSNMTFIKTNRKEKSFVLAIPLFGILFILVIITLINFVCSPIFNAKSYSRRISVETGNFTEEINEVNFTTLPLLDKNSSEKLGDRVMGQMKELVSQFYVSDQYTQINYNNEILRVTPLEYADIIKWFSNRKKGVQGYITVNSVSGESELKRLNKGMKYMPSAHFNENLYRKLRFKYPTLVFGDSKFEIDNDGNPFWITPIYKYTGVGLKTRVTGVIILDPITGDSKKYDIKNVPTWVDNAYDANLIIEQVDNWGTYKGGYLNSIFGQKNVVNTTDGYNYLAMNDDIYLYTGITSVLADESNLGFILSNMRTGQTRYYEVAGAEEYSAMASAEGQVQQMNYTSTFPLLINLNNKPTYLVSLKDAAGLVKMYGFVDVQDYQKVVVTDASKGIEIAAQNYLENYASDIGEDLLIKKDISIKTIKNATKNGNTFYYIVDTDDKKYIASINLSDNLPFINNGDKLTIGYYKESEIIEIAKIIN